MIFSETLMKIGAREAFNNTKIRVSNQVASEAYSIWRDKRNFVKKQKQSVRIISKPLLMTSRFSLENIRNGVDLLRIKRGRLLTTGRNKCRDG